jgi:hypothetical protein
MKTSKIIYGGLAGGLAFFLLGWLIYGILLRNFMQVNYNNCASRPMEEMIWWAIILSNLGMSYLIAIVISWANSRTIAGGIKIAAILGFLISASMDLSMYSMSTMFLNSKALIIDVFVSTLMWAAVGFIISLVMLMGKKAA